MKRLEQERSTLFNRRLDVTVMTDRQLEEVIGIPGLSAAMDHMAPAETARVMNLLSRATDDAIAECREIVVRMSISAK